MKHKYHVNKQAGGDDILSAIRSGGRSVAGKVGHFNHDNPIKKPGGLDLTAVTVPRWNGTEYVRPDGTSI